MNEKKEMEDEDEIIENFLGDRALEYLVRFFEEEWEWDPTPVTDDGVPIFSRLHPIVTDVTDYYANRAAIDADLNDRDSEDCIIYEAPIEKFLESIKRISSRKRHERPQ